MLTYIQTILSKFFIDLGKAIAPPNSDKPVEVKKDSVEVPVPSRKVKKSKFMERLEAAVALAEEERKRLEITEKIRERKTK